MQWLGDASEGMLYLRFIRGYQNFYTFKEIVMQKQKKTVRTEYVDYLVVLFFA